MYTAIVPTNVSSIVSIIYYNVSYYKIQQKIDTYGIGLPGIYILLKE